MLEVVLYLRFRMGGMVMYGGDSTYEGFETLGRQWVCLFCSCLAFVFLDDFGSPLCLAVH